MYNVTIGAACSKDIKTKGIYYGAPAKKLNF